MYYSSLLKTFMVLVTYFPVTFPARKTFSPRTGAIQRAHRDYIAKNKHDHYVCAIFLKTEPSALTVLVFYYQGILEKVRMQRTRQFWAFQLLPKEAS